MATIVENTVVVCTEQERAETEVKTAKGWTDSQTEEFIELLKQNPCLFNTTIADYKDRNKKQKAIENIGSQLKKSDKDVKAKIKSLRTTYCREKRKKKKRKTGTGADEVPKSTWKYFEDLRFMDEFVVPKASISNFAELQEEKTDDEETDNLSDFSGGETTEKASTKCPLPCKKKKQESSKEDILLNKAIACMEGKKKQQDKMDDFDVFGKHVANELREIKNVKMQQWAKLNIQTTLFNAHMNFNQGPQIMSPPMDFGRNLSPIPQYPPSYYESRSSLSMSPMSSERSFQQENIN